MRTAAWETAPQRALRNRPLEARGKVSANDFGEGGGVHAFWPRKKCMHSGLEKSACILAWKKDEDLKGPGPGKGR